MAASTNFKLCNSRTFATDGLPMGRKLDLNVAWAPRPCRKELIANAGETPTPPEMQKLDLTKQSHRFVQIVACAEVDVRTKPPCDRADHPYNPQAVSEAVNQPVSPVSQRRTIRQLSESLVNRIAAGEVIERPASVVKELVENSIDAGATHIIVEVEDGGRELIRVIDDGSGIPPNELPLAFASHATSKLQNDDDLFAINTMGFRGEALASIGEVSHSRILSRTRDRAENRANESANESTSDSNRDSAGRSVSREAPGSVRGASSEGVAAHSSRQHAKQSAELSAGNVLTHPAENAARESITKSSGESSESSATPALTDSSVAYEIFNRGGAISDPQAAAGNVGTTIEIRNLFFNTPARRKFMKGASTEFGHIQETLLRTALPQPAVSFKLLHNGRVVLDLPASDEETRLLAAWPDEFHEQRLAVRSRDAEVKLRGIIGLPECARPTGKYQYFFLNGRPIRDKFIQHAVRESYRGLTEPGRYPAAILLLTLPPEDVDVNVHPTKAEVRFKDSGRIHGLVMAVLREKLLGSNLAPPAVPMSSDADDRQRQDMQAKLAAFFKGSAAGAAINGGAANGDQPMLLNDQTNNAQPTLLDGLANGGPTSVRSNATGEATMLGDNRPNGYAPISIRPPLGGIVPNLSPSPGTPGEGRGEGSAVNASQPWELKTQNNSDQSPFGFVSSSLQQDVERTETLPSPQPSPGVPGEGAIRSPQSVAASAATPAIQLHNSYLVAQSDDGLVIIDQHALHERIMFEELIARITRGPLESQRLLIPITLAASARQTALLEQIQPLLLRLGIELSSFGPETIAIQSFPSFLEKLDPAEFVRELLERGEQELLDLHEEELLHEILDMMACKAAVKAGDPLTPGEIEALLARRELVERSSNCPHGRPTTLRLSLRDLEKQFKRTGF